MGLKYFEQYGQAQAQSPHEMYTELAQAFLNEEWDNTAAKTPENGGQILEQQGIGSDEYKTIEAWVKTSVGDITTGLKDSRDFLRLYFRDISHTTKRGLYYKFQDNYWIVNDYSHFNGIAQDVGVRRCNNALRILDATTNTVFSAPCVVDYDMGSSSEQISRYIITPNNHAVVKVQGNSDTLRLFKINTRYVLNGRVYKLLGFQNTLNYSLTDQQPTYLEMDLYLDEIHSGDDLVNAVADNSSTDYPMDENTPFPIKM